MAETEIGKVVHYFDKIGVAVVAVTKGTLKVGDQIHIVGAGADFEQPVGSLQVEKEPVEELKVGKEGGLKVEQKAKEGAKVFKVTE